MITTPDNNKNSISPIVVQSTNLQTGDNLVHRVNVPNFAPALVSPTGISSVNMNPMSNGDSTYSFAVQASNMGMLNNDLREHDSSVKKPNFN